jgi:hypothetical protein
MRRSECGKKTKKNRESEGSAQKREKKWKKKESTNTRKKSETSCSNHLRTSIIYDFWKVKKEKGKYAYLDQGSS